MLSRSLVNLITRTPTLCVRPVFEYKIEDISTEILSIEPYILTQNQKSYYNKAVVVGELSKTVNLLFNFFSSQNK
jgi:hypothetical protein